MADRTCIVTREILDPSAMVRFVAGPDGFVVPDLKRNLPGRGVWVSARRSCIEEAVAKSAFSRGLKTKALADETLPDLVDGRFQQAALGALGFARKAGQCLTGSGKVDKAIRAGNAIGILHSTDGAEDGLRKLRQAVYAGLQTGGQDIKIWRIFSTLQLSIALGATNVIHAALIEGSAARNCVKHVAQLSKYREMEPS
ncbi:MAG: RNA-binding protein [Rhizobiaceae bacterium]